ncbi:MAG TPA: DNA repair protein RadC [Candidatus Omnitrophota bacterium]|nr:DNA repair protein RadC [Candidatus Omnitrophota bacterium]HPS37529.1 DNA repair protein RadC [Candidatus Omnitrophota bacterium]
MIKSVKDWPLNERPREKLLQKGPETLSDAELLAVVFGHGMRGKDVVSFSRELLLQFGGLRGLLSQNPAGFGRIKGLGQAKIAMLYSLREIGLRHLREKITGQNFVRSPQAVTDYLSAALRDQKREIFKVLFLDKALRILGERDLFYGTIDEAAVHPREIVKAALECHASNLVLVHNHPSGKIEPSREDYEITQKIKAACQTVSIRILDHIIVGENQYFSFSERNSL